MAAVPAPPLPSRPLTTPMSLPGLSYPVFKGIMKKGYKVPTPIQRKVRSWRAMGQGSGGQWPRDRCSWAQLSPCWPSSLRLKLHAA